MTGFLALQPHNVNVEGRCLVVTHNIRVHFRRQIFNCSTGRIEGGVPYEQPDGSVNVKFNGGVGSVLKC